MLMPALLFRPLLLLLTCFAAAALLLLLFQFAVWTQQQH